MIFLRPFTNKDASMVLSWTTDERSFYMWCSDRFKNYPLPAEELCAVYNDPSIKGYIAQDGEKNIGHLFIQNLGNRKYKFGLIIVDPTQRGKGYGRKILECAISYAKESLKASSVSLCVFDENVSARELYKKIGFEKTGKYTQPCILGENKKYFEMEYTIKE